MSVPLLLLLPEDSASSFLVPQKHKSSIFISWAVCMQPNLPFNINVPRQIILLFRRLDQRQAITSNLHISPGTIRPSETLSEIL